jgi:hypothetical protein
MLITLRAAVENTVEGRHAAGAACFARPPLDLDRFFAAIISPLRGVRPHCSLTQTLPVGVDPRSCGAPSQTYRIKPLSWAVNEP